MKAKSVAWFVLLVVAGVFTRWIPHPPNFTALLAVALFAGFVLPAPLALATPILAAVIGDAWLGFHEGMSIVYLSLIPLVYLGRYLPELSRRPGTWAGWALNGLVGAVLFYLTTNLAVWWFSGMYTHDAAGLTSCFVLAIPFFHNSVLSTWLFLGAFAAVRQWILSTTPAFAKAPSH